MSSDVNLDTIAAQLDGYSGADITNVCRDAAMMAMRRAVKGKKAEEIRAMSKEELDSPTTAADFAESLSRCNRSVGQVREMGKKRAWRGGGRRRESAFIQRAHLEFKGTERWTMRAMKPFPAPRTAEHSLCLLSFAYSRISRNTSGGWRNLAPRDDCFGRGRVSSVCLMIKAHVVHPRSN